MLGGGFGGLYAALRLQKMPWRGQRPTVTLVDKRDKFTFLPLLYEFASELRNCVWGGIGVLSRTPTSETTPGLLSLLTRRSRPPYGRAYQGLSCRFWCVHSVHRVSETCRSHLSPRPMGV